MKKLVFALFLAVTALGLGGGAGLARADEKPVKEADVPKPVLDAVKKKYPKATLRHFERETEGEKVLFEVAIEDGKRKIDVDLSPEGKILAEEETIALDAVPDAVKKALADSKYGKATVKRVERVVTEEKEDAPSFEFYLVEGEKRCEVVFDKTGKIVKEEEKKAKKAPEPGKGEGAGKEKEEDDDD